MTPSCITAAVTGIVIDHRIIKSVNKTYVDIITKYFDRGFSFILNMYEYLHIIKQEPHLKEQTLETFYHDKYFRLPYNYTSSGKVLTRPAESIAEYRSLYIKMFSYNIREPLLDY